MFDLRISNTYRNGGWWIIDSEGNTVDGPFTEYADAQRALDDYEQAELDPTMTDFSRHGY